MFATAIHFKPNLIFAGKPRSLPSEWSTISALAAHIRIEFKCTAVTNALAYNDTSTITALKSFIVQGPGAYVNFVIR